MIECIFTLDYEIYGNGQGSLRKHVYEPAEKLISIFSKWNARFVAFVEVAELELIETHGTDNALHLVMNQIRTLDTGGFEIGLHIHPQWYGAEFESGTWHLDYSEYNLCSLSRERISAIVDRSCSYLRRILEKEEFVPTSFRAGNWLFQPTRDLAYELAKKGIGIDSSVYKGGRQHQHRLDYRPALKNGYFWRFSDDINAPDPHGLLLELPVHSRMVPFWRLMTNKRIGIQRGSQPVPLAVHGQQNRLIDFLRLRYPLKFDFCRMTINELIRMMDHELVRERKNPTVYRPLVLIGHTKDLSDDRTVDSFLEYLNENRVPVSTLREIYDRHPIS